MNADQLRAIMRYLRDRVVLADGAVDGEVAIEFRVPTVDDMVGDGLDEDGSRSILDSPWWAEMVSDVVETPDMCEADDPPAQVLNYARDVISEYIRKRATL
jgi:hypothetical protein